MTIEVNLTGDEFRRFSTFDTFRRRKMWRSPVTFASILGFCALICYLMHHIDGAVMLGSVLLTVGLGMPLAYFVSFFTSVRKQIQTLGLSRPQKVYTLHLTEKANGIAVENEREQAEYKWKDVFHVYRGKTAAYLFMTPTRAFILPYACTPDGSEALWQLVKKKVPQERLSVL